MIELAWGWAGQLLMLEGKMAAEELSMASGPRKTTERAQVAEVA